MGRGGVRVLVPTVYYIIFKSDYLSEKKKKAIRITVTNVNVQSLKRDCIVHA